MATSWPDGGGGRRGDKTSGTGRLDGAAKGESTTTVPVAEGGRQEEPVEL